MRRKQLNVCNRHFLRQLGGFVDPVEPKCIRLRLCFTGEFFDGATGCSSKRRDYDNNKGPVGAASDSGKLHRCLRRHCRKSTIEPPTWPALPPPITVVSNPVTGAYRAPEAGVSTTQDFTGLT